MAEQIKLNTRLQLRYDLLTKWNDSTLPLLAGEVAIAKDGNNIIIKVGEDGAKTWNDLPVANVTPAQYTELAGRVSTLEADLNTAVTGVKARLSALEAKFGEGDGTVEKQIADAVKAEADLRVAADNAINATIGTVADGKTVVGLIGEEKDRAEAAELAINNKIGDVAEGKTVVQLIADEADRADTAEKANAQAIADEAAAARAAEKALGERIDAHETLVGALPEGATATTVVGYVDEKVAAEKSRAEGIESGLRTDVDAIKDDYLKATDKTDLEGKITAEANRATGVEGGLDSRIATIEGDYLKAEHKTALEGLITAEETRATGVENGLAARIQAVEDDYLKAADKKALQDQITENANAITVLTDGIDPDKIDGLTDLVNWANEHAPEVESIKNDIEDNAKAIADEAKRATDEEERLAGLIAANAKAIEDQAATDALAYETKTDAAQKLTDAKGYADGIVATEKADREAADAELSAAIEAAKTAASDADAVVLGQAQSYADEKVKALADGAVAANTAAIAAIQNGTDGILAKAKEYADGLNTAMDTRVDALEGTVGNAESGLVKAVADNAAAIAGINDATNGILVQAKNYTDALANGQVKTNKEAIDAINHESTGILALAKAYTDGALVDAKNVATTTKLGVVKASDTVAVAEDGTMSVAKVSTDVLVNGTNEFVLYGGNSTGFAN